MIPGRFLLSDRPFKCGCYSGARCLSSLPCRPAGNARSSGTASPDKIRQLRAQPGLGSSAPQVRGGGAWSPIGPNLGRGYISVPPPPPAGLYGPRARPGNYSSGVGPGFVYTLLLAGFESGRLPVSRGAGLQRAGAGV